MPSIKTKEDLPDIQNQTSGYPKIPIKKVGIKNVRVPLSVIKKDGTTNSCSSNISIYTNLTGEYKGTNMSRYRILIEELLIDRHLLLHDFIKVLLAETKKRLEANNAYVKICFPYYLVQESPASKIKSYIDIDCVIEGKLINDQTKTYVTIKAPYTSCCPCSKEISSYGAHNQRSFASVTVELNNNSPLMWIEDIYEMVLKCSSAPIINGLKRTDESFQTELMYENPRFVEDVARLISIELDREMSHRISDYVVVVEHEESIHTHNAVAIVTAGRNLL
jgi:GTP cyclohydrolase I